MVLNNEPKTITFNDSFRNYRQSQLSSDAKLIGCVFVTTLTVLFHYLYVMKGLLDDPEMSYQQLALNFLLWAVTTIGVIYTMMYKVYPLLTKEKATDLQKKTQ